MDDVSDEVFTNARKQREDDDVVVQTEMWRHGFVPIGLQYPVLVVDNVDASLHKMRVVKRFEGVEFLGTLFCGAIAP